MRSLTIIAIVVNCIVNLWLVLDNYQLRKRNKENERLKWQYLTIALKSVQFVRLNQRDKDALAPFQIDYDFGSEDE